MPRSSIPFSEAVRRFLDQPRFATVGTVDGDGSPHLATVWYLLRDDTLIINSAVGRHWPANLERDLRCSLIVFEGYDHVHLKGRADRAGDARGAQADIAEMCRRYHPAKRAEELIRDRYSQQERVSFALSPDIVFSYGGIE